MANKKVSQLVSKPSVLVTDLFPIADPSTGQLFKTTISALGTAIGSGVSSVNTLVGAVVLDTDDIQELASPTNKYFTDTRSRAAISGGVGISYNSGTGVITNAVTSGLIATALGYTPADDALVVKLAGAQTITGTKTFNQAPLLDLGAGFKNSNGVYNYLQSLVTGWQIPVNGQNHNLIFSTSTNYIYTFPNASGTIALTSDLHNAVTIAMANGLSLSGQVLSLGLASSIAHGALSFTDYAIFNAKQTALNGYGFVKIVGTTISYDNSTYALDSAVVKLTGDQTIAGIKTMSSIVKLDNTLQIKNIAQLSNNTGYTGVWAETAAIGFYTGANAIRLLYAGNFNYTMPSADGTLALTSNLHAAVTIGTANGLSLSGQALSLALATTSVTGALSSADWTTFNNKAPSVAGGYLPLSGGTLTGALSGTSASFSGTSASKLELTGGTLQNGFFLNAVGLSNKFYFGAGLDLLIGTGLANDRGVLLAYNMTSATAAVFFDMNSDIRFGVAASVERMRITSAGNVGIGTTTPSFATGAGLAVFAPSQDARFALKNTASGDTATDGFQLVLTTALEAVLENRENASMRFLTNATEAMRITSGQLLAIGTTSVLINESALAAVSNGNTATLKSTLDGGNPLLIWSSPTVNNNGFVQFGTEGSFTVRGSITYNRGAGLTVFNTTSDYRIKTDISEFNALNIITKLKPKEYKIIDATNKSIGFIAHELQEFFPQAVCGEKDGERMQQVDYSQLTGLLTKGVQEVDTKVVKLEKEIISLKAELDILKNK